MAEWMEQAKWIILIINLVGLYFVAHGIRELITTRRFLERAQRAEGTIVSWRSVDVTPSSGDRASTPRTEDYPTVRFQAPDGQAIETEAELPMSTRLKVDTQVAILFNPADPHRARVATHGGRGYFSGASSVFLGLCAVILPHLWWGWW